MTSDSVFMGTVYSFTLKYLLVSEWLRIFGPFLVTKASGRRQLLTFSQFSEFSGGLWIKGVKNIKPVFTH